jgi:hypothetical protein
MSSLSWRCSETQCAALEKSRQTRWETPPLGVIQSTMQFAFTISVNGGRYSQTFQIMSYCNIIVPGERTYYRAQSTVCRAIVAFPLESCREWRDNLPLDSVIAMHGSWSQRRNDLHCVVVFIDANSGKVVDFEILEKPISFTDGHYFHSSNGMEVEGIRRIVNRWRANQALNSKVVAYLHDRDGKTGKLLTKIWPGKRELLGLNNVMKSFDRN